MHVNVGRTDRLARLVLAGVAAGSASVIGYGSAGGVVVLVVAGILTVTALVGYCPMYSVLRVTSRNGLHRSAAPLS